MLTMEKQTPDQGYKVQHQLYCNLLKKEKYQTILQQKLLQRELSNH